MKLSVRYQIIFLVFLVLALYYSALFAETSTVDDKRMITYLLNLDTFSFKGLFFPGGAYYYRPLLMLTFIFDKYVWYLQESFMHLENILLHAVNTIIVFGIARNIGKKLDANFHPELPFIAALFFAVHPIATESVNWISARTDLLSGTFLFLALYLLLRGGGRVSHWIILASAFSFLLACLSKDSAIAAFPAFLILSYTLMKDRDLTRVRTMAYLSFTGSALSYFVIRHIATNSGDTGIRGVAKAVISGDSDLFHKIRVVLKVFGFYVKKLFIPWPLNFAIIHVSNVYVVVGALALIACLILLFRHDINSVLFLLAASTVVPALLLPFGELTWTPVAERYLYMSTAPFCIAITFIVYGYWKRFNHSRLIAWSGAGLFILFAYSTGQRTLVWQNNLTFFEDAVKKTPDFAPIKNELALALETNGKREEANRIFNGNILPNTEKYSIITDMNRARVLMGKGKPAEARDILLAKKYERDKPLYVDYLEMLIAIDEKMLLQSDLEGRAHIQQEVRDALLSLAEVSGDPLYYYRIGKKFLALGMKTDAAKYFKIAYEKSPDSAFYKVSAKILSEKLSR
jgi:protein O-mannosyl-transferase